tara:strand:+ start:865 stop:1032 length:168 start_codon:yes stop_codon:yes gene_type:complete
MKIIDRPNWPMIILFGLNAYYWVCVWKYGFLLPTIWTIVIAAVIGLVLRVMENRY